MAKVFELPPAARLFVLRNALVSHSGRPVSGSLLLLNKPEDVLKCLGVCGVEFAFISTEVYFLPRPLLSLGPPPTVRTPLRAGVCINDRCFRQPCDLILLLLLLCPRIASCGSDKQVEIGIKTFLGI